MLRAFYVKPYMIYLVIVYDERYHTYGTSRIGVTAPWCVLLYMTSAITLTVEKEYRTLAHTAVYLVRGCVMIILLPSLCTRTRYC